MLSLSAADCWRAGETGADAADAAVLIHHTPYAQRLWWVRTCEQVLVVIPVSISVQVCGVLATLAI